MAAERWSLIPIVSLFIIYMSRKSRKGVEITPHKGGRTIPKTARVTPKTNELLKVLKTHGVSLGDLIEAAAEERVKELESSS